MSAEPPNNRHIDDELRDLWQTQKVAGEKMSLDEIREKARDFERGIRRRNLMEYAAGVIVLVSFGVQMFQPEPANVMTRIGSGLTVLAAIYVIYVLYTRGAAKNIPDAIGRTSFIEFYKSSLESRRDLLRDVWKWYLLPFVPGLFAMLTSFAIRDGLLLNPAPSPNQLRTTLFLLVFAGVLVGFFFMIAAMNRRHAKRLQSEIDALQHQL